MAGIQNKVVRFLASSLLMRLLLAVLVVVSLVLIPRPSQPITVLILLAGGIYIAAHRPNADVRGQLAETFRAAAPYLALFVFAALVASFTAIAPLAHLALLPKMVALQCAVLILYCLGRLAGPLPLSTLITWIAGTLFVATVFLLFEERGFPLHRNLGIKDLNPLKQYAILNRAFLIVTLGLAILAVTTARLQWWWTTIAAIVFAGLICLSTHSDSAKLVVLIMLIGFIPFARLHNAMLLAAWVTAAVLMVAGPFLYDMVLDAWRAGPFGDFMVGTFLNRLETYADFSALIRESNFLGRGFNVSKLIANDPSLFTMPNRPCGQVGVFCPWHPHNAGLEVTTDLGFLGIAWLTLVLWRIRSVVMTLTDWQRPGVIVVVTAFLAVSFVADGVWQPWWWLVAGFIALWIGILQTNPDRPVPAAT